MTFYRCPVSLRSVALALGLALAAWVSVEASAFAACVSDPAATQKATDFIANPGSLLQGPNGPRSSDDIANDVQNFVAANPQALPAIIKILGDLKNNGSGNSSDYQKAIGTGLGKAAKLCQVPDLAFANEIQTQLAGVGSADANSQYAAITGTDPTRSVAAGGLGAGSPGGVGGSTGQSGTSTGGSSGLQTFVANSTSNNSSNYFGGSVGGAGGVSSSNTTTTTIVCTVSGSC